MWESLEGERSGNSHRFILDDPSGELSLEFRGMGVTDSNGGVAPSAAPGRAVGAKPGCLKGRQLHGPTVKGARSAL